MTEAVMNGVSAMEITAAYEKVLQGDRAAYTNAIAFGELLLRAQGNSTRGKWLKWLETNCQNVKKTVAYDYMKLAKPEHRDILETNFRRDGNFSMRGAMRLIKPPSTQEEKEQKRLKRKTAKALKEGRAEESRQTARPADLAALLREHAIDEILISLENARRDVTDLESLARGVAKIVDKLRQQEVYELL
jgi:hypothetical protein